LRRKLGFSVKSVVSCCCLTSLLTLITSCPRNWGAVMLIRILSDCTKSVISRLHIPKTLF
jgi:hypothetical protein